MFAPAFGVPEGVLECEVAYMDNELDFATSGTDPIFLQFELNSSCVHAVSNEHGCKRNV